MRQKMFLLTCFLFSGYLFFLVPVSRAAEMQQNVLVNCLDYYIRPDAPEHAGEPAWPGQSGAPYLHNSNIIYNGVDHVIMLKNKPGSLFTAGHPVYVMRNNTTGYAGNPAGHEAFCALDQTNSPLCTTEMMQPNSIKTGDGFRIVDQTKPIMPDASGNLTLPHVRSYTPLWHDASGTDQGDTQFFYGVQILDDSNTQTQTNALGTALKLGTFTPTGTIPDTTANCVSIWWDPAGKVIDAKTLEPVLETTVSLYRVDGGQKMLIQIPKNPFFKNPLITNASGSFNFAVDPGTYTLNTTKEGFTFPVEPTTLQSVRSRLEQLDPEHKYVDSTKLYNDPNEAIVEAAGETQFRYLVMSPNDPNYNGSTPVVLSSLISLAPNGNQIIQGEASHPKGIIRASVNGVVLAQSTADIGGAFTLEIPASLVPANTEDIQITEEKVSLVAQANIPHSFFSFLSSFMGIAYAQSETRVSKPLVVKPIPAALTGFVYAQNYTVQPNATVNVMLFGSVPYATGHSDEQGFISIPTRNLPPFGYTIEVRDTTGAVVNAQTPEQFIATNKTYAKETNTNYYRPLEVPALKPANSAILARVAQEIAAKKNSNAQTPHISLNTTDGQSPQAFAPTTVPGNQTAGINPLGSVLPIIFILVGLVGFAVVILLISKARTSTQRIL